VRRRPGAVVRRAIAGIALSLPACALPPSPAGGELAPVTTPSTDDRWRTAARHFVQDLDAGRADSAAAQVSAEVPASALSAARLRGVWAQLTGQLGALAALEPYDVSEAGGRHSVDLAARFDRSEVTLRVVLDSAAKVTGFWVRAPRPTPYAAPAYVDSAAFREVELQVGAAPALPAVLTLPRRGARFPIAVLVHGSGPNDRDESIGPNKPFRDLAWGLASRGVAVLRYDKRTRAHPASLPPTVTVEQEVIVDALAALAAARAAEGVDTGRVFLLGHSLGAALAPEIAARDGRVAGVVMLAPPARTSSAVLADQLGYLDSLTRAAGQTPDAQLAAARALLPQLEARTLPATTDVLGVPASYWYDLDDRTPLDRARALTAPMLLLFGGRDYQVTDADVRLWRDALAGRAAATVRVLPELNHLFVAGSGRATPAEYTSAPGHVAESVVAELARFLTRGAR